MTALTEKVNPRVIFITSAFWAFFLYFGFKIASRLGIVHRYFFEKHYSVNLFFIVEIILGLVIVFTVQSTSVLTKASALYEIRVF